MPSQSDFEFSAGVLERVAGLVETAFDSPSRQLASAPLVGGRLADEVAVTAQGVRTALRLKANELRDAALVCRVRAARIAEYRGEVAAYRRELEWYDDALRRWIARSEAYALDPALPPPGPRPVAPPAPAPLPAWADRE